MKKLNSQINIPKESELVGYLYIIRKRKWVVIISLITIVFLTALFTFFTTSIYESEATILYEEPKDTMFALDVGQPFYNKSAIINMTEQIKSRTIAKQVVRELPENVVRIFELPDPLPPDFSKEEFIAGILQKNLSVTGVRGSDVLKVKVQASDPVAARVIANAYVNHILKWNLHKKKEETSNIRHFIEEQLKVFQNRLNKAEVELQSFREKHTMISLNEASTEILSRITDAEINYNQVKTEISALSRQKRFIDQKIKEQNPYFTMKYDPSIQESRQKLSELEKAYSLNQAQGETVDSRKMMKLKLEIDSVKQEIIQGQLDFNGRNDLLEPLSQLHNLVQESINTELALETNIAKKQALEKILKDYNAKLQMLPEQEMQLAHYLRDMEVNKNIFNILQEKLQEARISEASKVGDVHIVDPANTPEDPISPKKKRNLLIGIFLGLFFGIGLAFILETLDNSLKSQEDVENYINLSVLASVPSMSNGKLPLVKKDKHIKESYESKLLNNSDRKSHLSEAYRMLQMNISFVNADNFLKSILITSANPGEGKTLNAINMAYAFSLAGKKTILMDCDLRRPMIHEVLNLRREPGLTNVLIKKNNLDEVIREMWQPNFNVISSGTLPPNPAELLNSRRMKNVLSELKRKYDIVIIDSAPIIAVTDTIILSKEVDGVCLVIKSGKTTYNFALKAKQLLVSSNAKIIGTILNDVDFKNVYGYYNDYYNYT